MNYQPSPSTTPISPAASTKIERQQVASELEQAIGSSSNILVQAKTVFPLTLFPDTLTIDRTKLTITRRSFYKTAEVLSISIEDILNVTATVGPFFGSIIISTRFFDLNKPYTVDHFQRSDALKIKRIAQGYIIARQRNIDCAVLPTDKLAQMLDELGKVGPEEKV